MPRRSIVETSTIATKVLIAVTGLALFLYLIVHLAGNLILLLGPEKYNGYAATLMSNPLIVPVEIGLAAIFVLHIFKTVTMWWGNRKARPDPYYKKNWAGDPSRKSIASSTMIYTGLITLVFIVFHVRMFKYGAPGTVPGTNEEDLYGLVTGTFHHPAWVLIYEVCLVLLGFHLWHGFSSAFESLGVHRSRSNRGIIQVGKALAIIIAGGFFFIPLWIYFR